ncbi:hypothetical protein EIP86_010277 [Pleurotus ostreatoroseus]|nr:hypothetical protein EIP86_010277 [Pleurotus ostreatoroseus]
MSQAEASRSGAKTNTPDLQDRPLETEGVAEPSEAQVQRYLEDAEELKQEGNDYFRTGKWNEALASYRSALGRLPKRKAIEPPANKGKQRETLDDVEKEDNSDDAKPEPEAEPLTEPTALDIQCAKARATLNANIGACYVKLEEHKEAVAACTEALRDDPNYIKALQRRASSNDKLDTWSSLASAQEDYNKLLTLLPPTSPQIAEIQRTVRSLKPRVETAQKRETGEMMDKLKGLGNSVLGHFGLSTDNFQFVPNGQGGYSMNFSDEPFTDHSTRVQRRYEGNKVTPTELSWLDPPLFDYTLPVYAHGGNHGGTGDDVNETDVVCKYMHGTYEVECLRKPSAK